jgi:broad specificity phosphatase PhoE
MKNILVARHGQTVANKDGRIMGQSDYPLTPDALIAAERMALALQCEDIQRIFSSNLGRASTTASIYARNLGVPVQLSANVAELSCGLWEGQLRQSVTPGGSGVVRKNWFAKPPEGESYNDAEPRISEFIKMVTDADCSGNVLIIGHAGINRVLVKLLLDLPHETAMRILFPHDIFYRISGESEVRRKNIDGEEKPNWLFEIE